MSDARIIQIAILLATIIGIGGGLVFYIVDMVRRP